MNDYVITSESVSEGHPDKIADQISDGILDAILMQDLNARVACETLVKNGMIMVAGEITTSAWVNIDTICREIITDLGYNNSEIGLDASSCVVLTSITQQSADISCGVDKINTLELGAGDQGMMYGYATNETEDFMPTPISLAHKLMKQQSYIRRSKGLPWLRPDGKCQVSVRYESGIPKHIDTVVFSTQHHPDINNSSLIEGVMEEIIRPVLPPHLISKETNYYINPTGRFVIGGPLGDCGLTGRKIIVDTYGGVGRHGGGCFSGKDPSKVDRSGAYMARYAAKNIVAAGFADRCEIQVSYAIGISKPVSIYVETFGTEHISKKYIEMFIEKYFDFRPRAIIDNLNLQRPIYKKTASFGHFGRSEPEFTWESVKIAAAFKNEAALLSVNRQDRLQSVG